MTLNQVETFVRYSVTVAEIGEAYAFLMEYSDRIENPNVSIQSVHPDDGRAVRYDVTVHGVAKDPALCALEREFTSIAVTDEMTRAALLRWFEATFKSGILSVNEATIQNHMDRMRGTLEAALAVVTTRLR